MKETTNTTSNPDTRIVEVTTSLLIPFIIIYGFYIQFHGDILPGGGFQAGVILSVAYGGLLLVFLCDANLEVARVAITHSIPFMSCYLVQDLILEWKRKVIPLCCHIQRLLVHTNSSFAILLWGHHHRGHPL